MTSQLNALLRGDFLSFARKAIRELEGTKLGDEPYLRFLAGELDEFAEGENCRLIINLPPGHLKTLLGSVCLTAWLLAHDPSLKTIIVSHAEHLSKTIARNIRTLLQSTWYKELFVTRIKKGHAAVEDFDTASGGGVFVTSFGGGFTGRRADVIIVDDPHDISDKLERIGDTIESFSTVLLSRLNDRRNGRVLVIAHRVHERDLSAYLMQQRKWRHVVLPLVAIGDQTYQTAVGAWHRRRGEFLRPGTLDKEDIDELRANSFNPDFEMLYQQDVASQGLPAITPAHFPTFADPREVHGPIVLSVDAGMTNRRTSAYSVVQVWCLAPDRYLLLDQFREQVDFAILRGEVKRLRRIYRPVAILVERAANGHALISDLFRHHHGLVRPIDPDGRSKAARLKANAATIFSRRVCLPAHAVWREAFVREFCEFPKGKFTDQVDATTQLLDHVSEFAGMAPSSHGAPGIAATATRGLIVPASPPRGEERGTFVAMRNGRPINCRPSAGPVLSIKTEVQY